MKGWNRHCRMIGLKMMGWNRRFRMIGKKMRAGSDIVDSSSHFPMICAQLCLQFTSTDYLSLLLTPLRIRWTTPLRIWLVFYRITTTNITNTIIYFLLLFQIDFSILITETFKISVCFFSELNNLNIKCDYNYYSIVATTTTTHHSKVCTVHRHKFNSRPARVVERMCDVWGGRNVWIYVRHRSS